MDRNDVAHTALARARTERRRPRRLSNRDASRNREIVKSRNRAIDIDVLCCCAHMDRNEVARIAALAHLEFSEPEIEQLARELSGILEYIDQLSEVQLDQQAPAAPLPTPMREDLVGPSLPIEAVRRNAPAFENGLFVVPRIIGGEP